MAQHLSARRLIALQYFARIPPRGIEFEWPNYQILLQIQDNLCKDLRLTCNPISNNTRELRDAPYNRLFLKELIAKLQVAIDEQSKDNDEEINSQIMEAFATLISSHDGTGFDKSQKVVYHYPDLTERDLYNKMSLENIFRGWNRIELIEDFSTIAKGTTGLKTWEASLRLAAHFLGGGEADLFDRMGVRILELGSGSGFLGTLVAKLAPKSQVCLSDMDGIALHRLRLSVDKNLPLCRNVNVEALDWLEDESRIINFMDKSRPHLILGSDIVYDPELFDSLCKVIKIALFSTRQEEEEEGGSFSFALIASTIRNEQTFSLFLESIARAGLVAKELTMIRPLLNLGTGCIVMTPSGIDTTIELFPSAHMSDRDGAVCLLKISRSRS